MTDRLKIRVWDKVYENYWKEEEVYLNIQWLLYPDNDNINNVEIEQCTGLKDKNGRLIFEGDIIFVNFEKGRVVWSDEDCTFFFLSLKEVYKLHIFPDFFTGADDYYKVIGNIHQNPELLK